MVKKHNMFSVNTRSIFILLALFLGFSTANLSANTNLLPENIISTNTCAECHEDAVDVWKQSKHFASYRNFHKTKEAKEIALQLGIKPNDIKRADSTCSSCHYTVGIKNNRVKPIAGISCQSCHGAASEWVDIHNDYGDYGTTAKTETAAHKKIRYEKMHSAGMVYPADLYGLATNCFQCHLIANPDLINNTDHPTSSDFDLVKRSQGDIRHYDLADTSKQGKLALAGLSAQLVQSLEALSLAKKGSRFSTEMTVTANHAAGNLQALATQLNDSSLAAIATELNGIDISAGNTQLTKIASNISAAAIKLVGVNGSITKSKNLAPIKLSPKAKTATKPTIAKPIAAATSAPAVRAPQIVATNITTPSIEKRASGALTPVHHRLIDSFNAYQPVSAVMCNSRAPWLKGRYPINTFDFSFDSNCLGVEIEKSVDTNLILFAISETSVVRLFPNKCRFLGGDAAKVKREKNVWLPLNTNQQAVAIGLNIKATTLIAVVSNEKAAVEYAHLLATTTDICQSQAGQKIDLIDLLKKLNRDSKNSMQWQQYR